MLETPGETKWIVSSENWHDVSGVHPVSSNQTALSNAGRLVLQLVSIDDFDVRSYSPDKSIADRFKHRNKVGPELAIYALRTYRDRSSKLDPKSILKFAAMIRVEKVIRPYLESVL